MRLKWVPWFADGDLPEEDRPPVPVPVTAIYSRTDGVARWYACIESAGPRKENIEIYGSHTGMAANVAAIVAISDRLAQADGQWAPFEPWAGMRHLFPAPETWRPHTETASA